MHIVLQHRKTCLKTVSAGFPQLNSIHQLTFQRKTVEKVSFCHLLFIFLHFTKMFKTYRSGAGCKDGSLNTDLTFVPGWSRLQWPVWPPLFVSLFTHKCRQSLGRPLSLSVYLEEENAAAAYFYLFVTEEVLTCDSVTPLQLQHITEMTLQSVWARHCKLLQSVGVCMWVGGKSFIQTIVARRRDNLVKTVIQVFLFNLSCLSEFLIIYDPFPLQDFSNRDLWM